MAPREGNVVVITGASSGIGAVTARVLAANGARVVVGARRTDRLATLVAQIRAEGGTGMYQAVDVTRRADVEALVQLAQRSYGRVDVMVNNAGLMPVSMIDKLEVANWERMIDVNIKGVLYGIAAALPLMQAQQAGHIINIASMAGHRVRPGTTIYSATKHAVRIISEGLRQELSGSNIRVTNVSPGVTESELAGTITDAAAREYVAHARATAIGADAIARAILFAIDQPRTVDVSELIIMPTGAA